MSMGMVHCRIIQLIISQGRNFQNFRCVRDGHILCSASLCPHPCSYMETKPQVSFQNYPAHMILPFCPLKMITPLFSKKEKNFAHVFNPVRPSRSELSRVILKAENAPLIYFFQLFSNRIVKYGVSATIFSHDFLSLPNFKIFPKCYLLLDHTLL